MASGSYQLLEAIEREGYSSPILARAMALEFQKKSNYDPDIIYGQNRESSVSYIPLPLQCFS